MSLVSELDNNNIMQDLDADFAELNFVRDSIESMTKFNQIEILRILTKNKNVTINENKYGIHINLSEVSKSTINDLKMYINYVNTQEIQLDQNEKQKENFKNIYFLKDVKDNSKHIINESSSQLQS
jgi:hypothetical protein